VDHVDIFHKFADMGNNEHTKMLLRFQDSRNATVCVTTPKVGETGINLTPANHTLIITQKFWLLNEPWQAFAAVIQLWQNRVPHPRILNTGSGGYANPASDINEHSGMAQMGDLHSWMSPPNITMMMIYRILTSHGDHTQRLTENGDTLESDDPSS